jgi:hypothetical protein
MTHDWFTVHGSQFTVTEWPLLTFGWGAALFLS